MLIILRRLTPFFLLFFTFAFIEAGITTDYSDARSRFGGRSFKRPVSRQKAPSKAPASTSKTQTSKKSGFGKGLAGGLLGGAIGGLLLGSLFGMGGDGMGILPLLLLGGAGYFLFRRFTKARQGATFPGNSFSRNSSNEMSQKGQINDNVHTQPPIPDQCQSLQDGIHQIQSTDPGFDINYFTEIASDVFFQVQAGWMHKDLTSYQHLLGEQLASEYKQHFKIMREQGHINKLESIAIRKVEPVDAGNNGPEDFITVLFKANLLDYTVDENSGDLIEGDMTTPIKFAEKWTWARSVNTEDWKLEQIEVVKD